MEQLGQKVYVLRTFRDTARSSPTEDVTTSIPISNVSKSVCFPRKAGIITALAIRKQRLREVVNLS